MELYAHNISDLASNLSVHLATISAKLAKAAQEANALTDNQTMLIMISAHALLIRDYLDFPNFTPEGRAQSEAVAVNIITNLDGERHA